MRRLTSSAPRWLWLDALDWFRLRRERVYNRSRYSPHQGVRECARRRRQIERGLLCPPGVPRR